MTCFMAASFRGPLRLSPTHCTDCAKSQIGPESVLHYANGHDPEVAARAVCPGVQVPTPRHPAAAGSSAYSSPGSGGGSIQGERVGPRPWVTVDGMDNKKEGAMEQTLGLQHPGLLTRAFFKIGE